MNLFTDRAKSDSSDKEALIAFIIPSGKNAGYTIVISPGYVNKITNMVDVPGSLYIYKRRSSEIIKRFEKECAQTGSMGTAPSSGIFRRHLINAFSHFFHHPFRFVLVEEALQLTGTAVEMKRSLLDAGQSSVFAFILHIRQDTLL